MSLNSKPAHARMTIGLLWHSANSNNLGIGALTASHVAIIDKIAHQMGIAVQYNILCWRDPQPAYIDRPDINRRAMRARDLLKPSGLFAEVRRCDVILDISAGDSFADIYGVRRFSLNAISKVIVLLAGRPLIMSPQTIGPFQRWWTRRIAGILMRAAKKVVTRDKLTTDFLAPLKLGSKLLEATDVAFLLPYERATAPSDTIVRVGLNASGLLFNGGYTQSNMFGLRTDYPEMLRALIRHFSTLPDCQVHLIGHVNSDHQVVEDDYRVAQRLAEEFPEAVLAPRFEGPSQAKSYISSMDFFSGSRMHACIAAFSAGVPVLPIAYSRKFAGVFGTLGYNRVADCTTHSTDEIVTMVKAAFEQRDTLKSEVVKGQATAEEKLAVYDAVLRDCLRGGRAPAEMTMTAKSLRRVLKSNCCSGCGLCAAVSNGDIEMEMSREGYLRPKQRKAVSHETDRLIAETCPGISLTQTSCEGVDHPLWGPIIETRTGASTDPTLRHHASSGGALSALLVYLLESGTVDYILQTAASKTAPLENTTVVSKSYDDIYEAAGSRYAPSAPLSRLLAHLEQPGRFALVAKPCDIAATRALGEHDPRVAEKIPIMISFFCAGIPSTKGARAILQKLNAKEDDVAQFRYRGDGWPGRATATLKNNRKLSMNYAASWGDILSNHVQFRCKICPDGSGGFADIVCADAWHADEKGYPLFEEKDGRSLIVTRTTIGEEHVSAAIHAGHLTADDLNARDVEIMQPSQAQRKRLALSRLFAMALLGRSPPLLKGLNILNIAISAGFRSNIRSFLGTVRRIISQSC